MADSYSLTATRGSRSRYSRESWPDSVRWANIWADATTPHGRLNPLLPNLNGGPFVRHGLLVLLSFFPLGVLVRWSQISVPEDPPFRGRFRQNSAQAPNRRLTRIMILGDYRIAEI
jgi:hypothetical protein